MGRTFSSIALVLLAASVQAALVAHYEFSDGELLGNEVGEGYTLRQVQAGESPASVRLNGVEESAVFTGGNAVSAWRPVKKSANIVLSRRGAETQR